MLLISSIKYFVLHKLQVVSDLTINIIKLEKLGLSPSQLIASLTLIVIGILTYYVAPMAFLNNNIPLFLFILNIILISMILGNKCK